MRAALLLCLALLGAPAAAQEPAVSTAAVRGDVREALLPLKQDIRRDLNAVRRARYALRKAHLRGDAAAEERALEALAQARARLKADRLRLRETLRRLGLRPRRGRSSP